MGAHDSFVGTTPVRQGHAFDVAGLERWMRANVAGFAGPVTVEQFRGGQSNPTFKLVTPERTYVLRRKPTGAILKGAHAVEREARVIAALGAQGFPVARVYGLCTDDAVIGSWFYVMEMVEGRIFWDASFPEVPHADRPRYFDAMNTTIAALHRYDPDAIGLGDYGRPGNYFERQIGRWSKQYLDDPQAGRDPAMDALVEWLPANIPPGDEARVVHGDFRCDNMIFHPSDARVIAVLDWELSTLGHPLADFAYHLMMYRMPAEVASGLAGADLAALNIPSEADYVAAYCRRTGRDGIPHLQFYIAFNFFRLTAILHGVRGRYLRGSASSAQAEAHSARWAVMARTGWDAAQRA